MDEMTPTQLVAAFHGLATNRAIPLEERLECALKALELQEAELGRRIDLSTVVGYRVGDKIYAPYDVEIEIAERTDG